MRSLEPELTLMLFSIGPVQEFIAQARRTRDLWFGSHLLSELSKAGAREFQRLASETDGSLIFPTSNDVAADAMASAPNKILGQLVTANPKDIAWQVQRAIKQKWKFYANEAKSKVESYINLGIWDRQVNDLIEFNATWVSLDRVDQDYMNQHEQGLYPTAYSYAVARTDAIMSARKLLRDFKPNNPGRLYGDKKSTLDGGRESVWLDLTRDAPKLAPFGVDRNETLDAISVIKRLSLKLRPNQDTFESVCETAFLPFYERIGSDPELRQASQIYLDEVNKTLRPFRLEKPRLVGDATHDQAQLFYARRIKDYLDETTTGSDAERQDWTEKFTALLEDLYLNRYANGSRRGTRFPRPTPYYAFLLADGDHMGKQLRKIADARGHIRFSQALSAFSTEAAVIMKEHKGQLVYGGGDDVMAYLPIHTCLHAADALKHCFIRHLTDQSPDTGESLPLDEDNPPTLSVGLVIVHMLEPLEEVRLLAMAAEQEAKKTRNALAVHLHKRSGADAMKASFSFANDPVRTMNAIGKWFNRGYFSTSFAYGLRELYRTYKGMPDDSPLLLHTEPFSRLLWLEIERLVDKKKPEGQDRKQIKSWLDQELKPLFIPGDEPLQALHRLAEMFIITLQLKEAGGIHGDDKTAATTAP